LNFDSAWRFSGNGWSRVRLLNHKKAPMSRGFFMADDADEGAA
jgi:hypothetical protein